MNDLHRTKAGRNPACSLVTYAYQSIGVMERPPKGPLPNNVLPGDFALEGNLILSAGYALAPTLTYLGE